MLICRSLVLIAFAVTGCATPGDPSCAVYDEITDRSSLREVLYAPELDPVGLHETTWYNCPTAWTPACPGVDCRPCDARLATAIIERDELNRTAPKATATDEVPPAPRQND